MKIVIAGGRNKADFLIGSLLHKNHKLVVINDDMKYCEYLASAHEIPVVNGDPCKLYVLDNAHINDFDILIALKPDDADNLAICQTAKRIYGIKKVVCTVSNPKNVDVFKKLGVNTVISATYMVANIIEQSSTIENFIQILSIVDEKVNLSEIIVDKEYPVVNKRVSEIDFPPNVIISCIIRNSDVILPNGQTLIMSGDKLLFLSTPDNQKRAFKVISGGK